MVRVTPVSAKDPRIWSHDLSARTAWGDIRLSHATVTYIVRVAAGPTQDRLTSVIAPEQGLEHFGMSTTSAACF